MLCKNKSLLFVQWNIKFSTERFSKQVYANIGDNEPKEE